jgi:hypothetical protein
MGAVSILGFGALEGFGWCWVMGFLRVLLGSALWASWALPLYTPCVLRGALRFFLMKFLLTYQKKKKVSCQGLPTTKRKPPSREPESATHSSKESNYLQSHSRS